MKKEKALERVKEEINKIADKTNAIYFFVYDTKGVPNGSLEYIYRLADIAKNAGYKVAMLHQEDEFVGVGEWLGEDFASLDHYNVAKDSVEVTPSDILFIPEVFASVMNQTKKLPCKRVAILQNYDYVCEEMPFSAQWGSFGIMDAITTTEENEKLLGEIFPYVHTTRVTPYIGPLFGKMKGLKQMIVNIVAKRPEDVNRIIKPFYWKYPTYKWVSFRDLRGLPKTEFARAIRENAITVWVDDDCSFGYSALEAMKSGSIVIGKVPSNIQKWMEPEGEGNGMLRNCCVWFDNIRECHRQIASVVRSWITDNVPSIIQEEADKVVKQYSKEQTEKEFVGYLEGVLNNRKKELEGLLKLKENESDN